MATPGGLGASGCSMRRGRCSDRTNLEYLQSVLEAVASYGVANLAIVHRLSDLRSQTDDGTSASKVSMGLLADTQTRMLFRPSCDQVAEAEALLGLTTTEAQLLPRLVKGRALWKVAGRSAVVAHTIGAHEAEFLRHRRRHDRRMTAPRRAARGSRRRPSAKGQIDDIEDLVATGALAVAAVAVGVALVAHVGAQVAAITFGGGAFSADLSESVEALLALPSDASDPAAAWPRSVATQLPGPFPTGDARYRSCSSRDALLVRVLRWWSGRHGRKGALDSGEGGLARPRHTAACRSTPSDGTVDARPPWSTASGRGRHGRAWLSSARQSAARPSDSPSLHCWSGTARSSRPA